MAKITAEMLIKQSEQQAEQSQSPLAAYNDAYLYGGSAKPLIIKDGDKVEIELSKLKPYQNQPFQLYNTDKMSELADNIKENGVLNPLIVRPIENTDNYEILAGHNRAKAAELAGLDKVPCIVRYVDDEQAALILVDTNLQQREEILPSEKAFAYKLRLDAMKKQGKRTDIQLVEQSSTSSQKSRECVDDKLSGRQVQKYIRLTYLVKPLLQKVDDKQIPVNAGVELSYIDDEQQRMIYNNMRYAGKLPIEQAKLMRMVAEQSGLTNSVITSILAGTYIPPKSKAEQPIESAPPETVSKSNLVQQNHNGEQIKAMIDKITEPASSPAPTVEVIPSVPIVQAATESKEKSPTEDTTADDKIVSFAGVRMNEADAERAAGAAVRTAIRKVDELLKWANQTQSERTLNFLSIAHSALVNFMYSAGIKE